MNVQVLIDSIMRQTTVLIAQLATTGGVRAPLSHIANQVFVDLSRELEDQGVSRKVSADMFGMALRAYIRKLQRLNESTTERGRSLWQATLDFVASKPVVSRAEVLSRFHRDDPATVRGILYDLTETGLVFSSGSGDATVFRAVAEEEARYAGARDDESAASLLSVLVYREGPMSRAELHQRSRMSDKAFDACLERLLETKQISLGSDGQVRGEQFHLPIDGGQGWEAPFLDHFHALVQTLCARLEAREPKETCGGSTYTFEVWSGHPMESEVLGVLSRTRASLSELQRRVETYNGERPLPDEHARVVCYTGQHVVPRGGAAEDPSLEK